MAEGPPPEDFSKLPLEEKLSHKVWRARLMGYEEATKLFRRIDDEKSSEYNKFSGMMKKFVVETNAMAQEKALEATLAFVECASAAERTCEAVVAGIVVKCLNARPKTKQAGIDVCLMYTEIEQGAIVQEEITKGLSNKQPKVVTACILVLRTMLVEFGAKVVNMKLLLKAMPGMFEHSDKNVRVEAKLLAVEVYRWMGAPLRGILEKNLKPVQMKELDDEWGKMGSGEPAVPNRRLRSQQESAVSAFSGGGAAEGEVQVGGASDAAIDTYDFLDPVDVLGQMPKDFFTRIVDTKWKERKEVLEILLPLAQSPKITAGDYTELMKSLRKVITKDSNVMVVALAGNIVAGLATGLRKAFQTYAPSIVSGIFEKFKEKKQMVIMALRDAADAAYVSTTLGNIQEQVLEALENKNPCVKSETLLFLCRCFQQCTPAMLPKASLKTFCPPIIKQIDSADPTVREAAFESIATLLKVVGERPMNIYIETVDKTKMAKIQEHKEKVELKIKLGLISSPMAKPKAAAASSVPKTKPHPSRDDPPKKKPDTSVAMGDTSLEISFDNEREAKPLKKKPVLGSQKRAAVKTEEEASETGPGEGGANDSLLDVSFGDDVAAKPRKKRPVLSSTKKPPKRRSKKPGEEEGGGGGLEGEGESGSGVDEVKNKPPAQKPPSKKPAATESSDQQTTSEPAKPRKKVAASSGGGKGGKGGKAGKGKSGPAGGKADAPDPPEPSIPSEELDDKANAVLPAGLLTKFEDPKWKDRLEACEKMKEFLDGLPGDEMQSLLMIKVLGRKPGWKDSNFQVMKAKFAVVGVLAERAAVFGRKSTNSCLPALVEKLGDAKVKPVCLEVLMVIAERMTLNYTSLQVLKASFDQKSPKVHSETFEWLKEALTTFGFLINLKPHIDYIKKGFGASNPAVRTSAMNLLSTVYLYMGAQLRMFFEDEKAALLKQIDESFEKMSGQSPPAPTRGPNVASGDDGDEGDEERGGGGGGGGGGGSEPVSLADLMPKVDISGQIKSSLIAELSDKNWKVRGEGLTKVQEILAQAKFIQPSLGELSGALKARLGDSNKNHIITTVNIISSMATAMGSACTKFCRAFIPGVLQNITDAKPHVRAACVACLNIWTNEITLSPLIEGEFISTALQTESPNLRTELLSWLEEKLPGTRGKLPPEVTTIIPPIYACLEDRNGEVRKKAQAVIPVLMGKVGYDVMLKHSGKLTGNSKQAVKALLDKHRSSVTPQAKQSAGSSKKETTESDSKQSKSKEKAAKSEKTAATEEPPKKPTGGKGSAAKNKASASKQKKGGSTESTSSAPLVCIPNGKEQRMRDEEKMKVLRWNFNAPRTEHIVQLKDQLQPCVSPELYVQLCHDDFKQHLKALDTLTKAVSGTNPPHKDAAIGCMDLLLRWITLRFFDTNTTVNIKCLDFLHALFQMLIADCDYRMSDYEAQGFIPYLVLKVGDSKEPVRKGVRSLFREVCSFFSSTKLFTFVLDGLKSKNARQRTECLEELGILIQNNGMVVCGASPQKTVPLIAAQISDRDNTVRTAALNTFVIIHGNIGDGVYKFTSQLSDKDISLLEEKIRRYGKKAPQATSPVPPTAEAPPTSDQMSGPPGGKGRGTGKGVTSKQVPKPSLKPATSSEKLTDNTRPDPMASPPLPTTSPTTSEPAEPVSEPAKPVLVPGPYKLDWSKYQIPPRQPLPRLPDYDRSVFSEPDPPYPRFATHRLLKNPPAPVVLSPPRLATTSTAINYIISQVTSSNRDESVKALKQMEGVIANLRYTPALVPHVDHLLRAVLMQMKITFTTPLATANDPESQQQVMDHSKRLVSCLVAVFSEAKLALASSLECLCEVETGVLSYLCDERLLKLEDVAQLNRAFNYLMYRICENCDKTVLFGSLLRVLLKSISTDGTHTKLTELSMKCIWKITRQIPQYMSDLKVNELLKEMQAFFHGYTQIVPSPKPDDKPYRTAKTILFHLTEHMGDEILEHLSLVPEQSRVAVYVRKTLTKKRLSNGGKKEGGNKGTGLKVMGGVKSGEVEVQSPFLHDGLSLQDLVLLGEIIDKLNPATEHQGLRELHSFQLAHQDVDIPSLFRSQSTVYQSYIVKGLEVMKEEQRLLDNGETPAPFNPACVSSTELLEAKKRSRELREKTANLLNMDLQQTVRSAPVAMVVSQPQAQPVRDENMPITTAPPSIGLAPKPSIPMATTKSSIGSARLEDLRRRLEKLKGNN